MAARFTGSVVRSDPGLGAYHAGTGGAGDWATSARMLANRCRGTTTSAIWRGNCQMQALRDLHLRFAKPSTGDSASWVNGHNLGLGQCCAVEPTGVAG